MRKYRTYSFSTRNHCRNNFFVTCYSLGVPGFLLCDAWEHFTAQDVAPYFAEAHNLFLRRLKKLETAKRALKPKEAKELIFMLETLIDTKNMLYPKDSF